MSKKYLYYFSEGNDAFGGDKVTMKNTLGGKGAGLAEMTAAGMPVPQGFTITTDACTQYYADGRQINDEITADIFEHVKGLEEITGKKFGDLVAAESIIAFAEVVQILFAHALFTSHSWPLHSIHRGLIACHFSFNR